MIDYYETKQHPVTKKMVLDAYKQVRANKGSAGVDDQDLAAFATQAAANLYSIWNRMTSGSYYPSVVKAVQILKKGGGTRGLGIPTVSDRIAQQVVKSYLEPKVEESFHNDSYGYRPNRNAHEAIAKAKARCSYYSWVLDLDIKGFFDNIDHDLMMLGVGRYTQEKWVLNYIERWLKAGVLVNGEINTRDRGTPQGGVISPLLANIYLHFTFDMWMQKFYPHVPFERYCDDIIIHCTSEAQARFIKGKVIERMRVCKLEINEQKTQIVYCRHETHTSKHRRVSFDFLGYTFSPRYIPTRNGLKLLYIPGMSRASKNEVRRKVKEVITRGFKGKIQELAEILNPKIRGWYHYYCAYGKWTTHGLWYWLNERMVRWIVKTRKFGKRKAKMWLRKIYEASPNLFLHWQLVRPY